MLHDNETAEAAFYRLVSSKSSHYHAKLKVMVSAASNVKKINEVRQRDGQEKVVKKEDDDPQLFGEAKNAMTDVLDMTSVEMAIAFSDP